MEVALTALIQADLLVYQTATAFPVVSTSMATSEIGGLLQSLVPPRGCVYCSTAASMSTEATTITTTVTRFVASGIKTQYPISFSNSFSITSA